MWNSNKIIALISFLLWGTLTSFIVVFFSGSTKSWYRYISSPPGIITSPPTKTLLEQTELSSFPVDETLMMTFLLLLVVAVVGFILETIIYKPSSILKRIAASLGVVWLSCFVLILSLYLRTFYEFSSTETLEALNEGFRFYELRMKKLDVPIGQVLWLTLILSAIGGLLMGLVIIWRDREDLSD